MILLTKIITPPDVEPISLVEAKKQLRLAITDADAAAYTAEDDNLAALIKAARELVEVKTWRALITQTWDVQLDCFPVGDSISFPLHDLQSVASVTYTDTDGSEATFTDFVADTYSNGIRLSSGYSWPPVLDGSRIYIRYICGYGDTAETVPQSIKRAMLLIISHLHENTEEVVVGSSVKAILLPMGVDILLSGYRVREFCG